MPLKVQRVLNCIRRAKQFPSTAITLPLWERQQRTEVFHHSDLPTARLDTVLKHRSIMQEAKHQRMDRRLRNTTPAVEL